MTPTPNEWADLRETVGRIDERTKFLDRLAAKSDVNAVAERVKTLENESRWTKRSVIGSLIAALIALVKPHVGM